jgi:hypothetical protein
MAGSFRAIAPAAGALGSRAFAGDMFDCEYVIRIVNSLYVAPSWL